MTNIDAIVQAYQDKDLVLLQSYVHPTLREINSRKDFASVLMLSCNKIKHLLKIPDLHADCIMLNLEDGVSKEEKPFALALCGYFLSHYTKIDKKLVVRVNALDEGGFEEIEYLNQFMPDAIRVPKIKNQEEVQRVLAILNKNVELHLSIETAQSWNNLSTLGTQKRVTCFYLGILDLFADLKLSQTLIDRDNPTMLYILSHFLITSRALGVKPVSFVYQEFQNLDEFSLWLDLEKKMGYDAKGCISPKQVDLVNQKFVDEVGQLQRAQRIIELFEMNKAKGITGFVDEEYGFIDEPIYKGALAVLEK